MMDTAHRPPKNKFGTSPDGNDEPRPSFLMCPPVPSKKAKLFHAHDKYAIDKNDSSDDNIVTNDTNDRVAVCSPTDVLTHPSAIYPSTCSLQNNTCIQPQVVINTLPPSLRGTTEAVKALNSSSCNSKSTAYRRKSDMMASNMTYNQKLVAFPTEALYVLTCCVKTASKKKLLRANSIVGNNSVYDDAVDPVISSAAAESSSSISTQLITEHQDIGGSHTDDGKVSYGSYGDVHPHNPSLDCLISRQTLGNDHCVEQSARAMATTLSVFVMDNKHAQHFCHFSQPKMFAIRPKESSGLMQPSSSSLFSMNDDVDGDDSSSRVGSSLDHALKQDVHNSRCTDNTTYSPFSPIISSPPHSSSMSAGMPTPIPPSPMKGSSMVDTGLPSSLCYPQTPNVKSTAENTPSSVESHAISPLESNSVADVSHIAAKMSPSLPLSSHATPINNHIGSPTHGTSKIRAASFSESYEAFSRLANRFWPGPVIIYAPARMINVGSSRKDSMPLIQPSQKTPRTSSTSSNEMSSASLTSLPSFTNLPTLESGEGGVPVLPPSVLIPAKDLLPRDEECDDTNEEHFFVGMQCPSHPLARKILTEIHRPRGSSSSSSTLPMKHSVSTDSFASMSSMDTSTTCQGMQQKHIRRGIAVVGSYIEPLLTDNTAILANTAENATKILSSSTSSNNDDGNQDTQQIYVVNGEDTTREKFSIPTCNYGRKPSISLLVDGDSRTIYLLHRRNDGNDYNHVKERVYRALLQAPSLLKSATATNVDSCSNKMSSTKEIDRVITAVLSRWKVEERAV